MPPLNEALLIPDHAPNLDDVACHAVLEDLDGLWRGHGASKQLDKIARIENGCRIECLGTPLAVRAWNGAEESHLARCLDRHGTFDKIENWDNAKLVESLGDEGPRVAEISFAVFGKQGHERRLFEERAGRVLLGEGLDLPLVDVVRIPRLGLLVCGRHGLGGVGIEIEIEELLFLAGAVVVIGCGQKLRIVKFWLPSKKDLVDAPVGNFWRQFKSLG